MNIIYMQKKTNYVKLDQDNNDRPTEENEEIHNLKVSLLKNTNLPLRKFYLHNTFQLSQMIYLWFVMVPYNYVAYFCNSINCFLISLGRATGLPWRLNFRRHRATDRLPAQASRARAFLRPRQFYDGIGMGSCGLRRPQSQKAGAPGKIAHALHANACLLVCLSQ